MRLLRLTLENFRSYPSAELHPDPGMTIIAGPNGAGKTNLLEATFVAITGGRGQRSPDHELVRHGSPFARVRLDFVDEAGGEARVELLIPSAEAPQEIRKRVEAVQGVESCKVVLRDHFLREKIQEQINMRGRR